ncbi:MAG: UDP-N-acetylmuramate dehydrogenase [Anaerolineaceae bacterium]|nr:UDP-N-acetylmuramate dehydrogenase [Anaerolineaceae bacterium]
MKSNVKLPEIYQTRLMRNEPLARYTAARLGGPADWLYIARDSTEELVTVIATAWQQGIPVRLLGGGANVLVSDKGIRGLVVINDVTEIAFGDWHEGRNVSATGGAGLTILARKCQAQGLSGLEWAVSVPGTVGGAVVNNAGAHGSDMATVVRDVVLFDTTKGVQMLTVDDLAYDYRYSSLKGRLDRRFLVLMATFALTKADPPQIKAQMDRFLEHRRRTQPPGASLGSIFKNPPGDYAGRLIDSIGLKGHTIGGVQVSPVHANFFINSENGTASDYYALIRYVRDSVRRETGVELELEIEIIGEWGEIE